VLAALSLETARLGSGHGCRALLYGGSVTTANADDLLDDSHTDGLFIGRAAWDVQGFLAFLAIAGRRVATAPAPTSD